MIQQQEKVFSRGRFVVAPAVAADGTTPAWDFYQQLEPADRAKMKVLFDYIAATGQIRHQEKFKKVEGTDDLFQFKSYQLRMPCFWDKNGVLFITHGFRKKQDRTPESEKARALDIKTAHRSRTRA